MKDNLLVIKIGGIGHFRRQIEAIRDGLTVMVEKLERIETTYCMDCGTELELKCQSAIGNVIKKRCPCCGQEYVFTVGVTDAVFTK